MKRGCCCLIWFVGGRGFKRGGYAAEGWENGFRNCFRRSPSTAGDNARVSREPSRALGLDYYSFGRSGPSRPALHWQFSGGLAFVEFTSPAMVAKQCRFELDNGRRGYHSVQLVGYDVAELTSRRLSRSFWNAV